MDPSTQVNRTLWDERVPIHLASDFYDVPGFRAGRDSLQPFEIAEVGDVGGRELVHLQCHIGLDTLSWARRGARVVGVDFSAPAVAAAGELARDLQLDAEFVVADVYSAPTALGGRTFDIVYTGHGALNWLPDIEGWAEVVDKLLRPGGMLYLAEFHPISAIMGDDSFDFVEPYFTSDEPLVWDEPGTYADRDASTVHNVSHEWNHPLGSVVTAIARRGLVVELLHERPTTLFRRWPFLVHGEDGTFRLPAEMPSLPLSYSLRARKP